MKKKMSALLDCINRRRHDFGLNTHTGLSLDVRRVDDADFMYDEKRRELEYETKNRAGRNRRFYPENLQQWLRGQKGCAISVVRRKYDNHVPKGLRKSWGVSHFDSAISAGYYRNRFFVDDNNCLGYEQPKNGKRKATPTTKIQINDMQWYEQITHLRPPVCGCRSSFKMRLKEDDVGYYGWTMQPLACHHGNVQKEQKLWYVVTYKTVPCDSKVLIKGVLYDRHDPPRLEQINQKSLNKKQRQTLEKKLK